jgi:sarcosine oxidase subunit gamma
MSGALAFLRRTPLRRVLDQRGATWRELGDAAIAESVAPGEAVRSLAIADLSPLPRLGFKGRGTIDAMKRRGIVVEAQPNRAFRQSDGGLCLVLAPGEVLMLSGLWGDAQRFADMEAAWRIEDEERTYPLPRRDSHAWFAVLGNRAPEMFAKLCGIDLRLHKFPDLAIAQTSLAKINAIIARADRAGVPLFHVLADSASALYLCSCLDDAAREFDGAIIGVAVLRDMEGP